MTAIPEPTRLRFGVEPPLEERAVHELSRDLRGLALALVGDEAEADDLVQEAWLAALGGPGGHVTNWKAWLRGVVRKLAFKRRSKSDRRTEVEALSAVPERFDAPETLERESAIDALRRTVDGLRDPYRSVLLLRYFEGRTTHEIALAAGCPYQTVKSQLRRGIGQLRDDLDRRHDGDRAAWAGALLPAFGFSRREVGTILSRDAARTGVGWVAGVVPLAAFGALLWLFGGPRDDDGIALAPNRPAVTISALPSAVAGSVRARTPAAPRESAVEATASGRKRPVLEVVVLGPDDRAVSEAIVEVLGAKGRQQHRVVDGEPLRLAVAEDELHRDLLPGPDGALQLVARAPGGAWSFLYTVALPSEGRRFELVVRGRGQTLAGHVVDPEGRPVVGARIAVDGDLETAQGVVDGTTFLDQVHQGQTGEEGRFVLEGLPVRVHRVRVTAPGLVPRILHVESEGELPEQRIELELGGSLRGELRRPDGGPAANARVRVWEGQNPKRGWIPETRSDEQGRYELTGLAPGRRRVFAQAADDEAVSATAELDVEDGGETTWNAALAPRAGLRVRVLEAGGEPVAGAFVVVALQEISDPWWGTAGRTDEQGLVAFPCVADGTLRLLIRRDADDAGSETPVGNVLPGAEEFAVELAPREARGSLCGVFQAPGERVMVTSCSSGVIYRVGRDATGAFDSGPLGPGTYELWMVVEGRGAFACGSHEVLRGEKNFIGRIVAPPLAAVTLDWGAAPPSEAEPWLIETEAICTSRKLVRTLAGPTTTLELYPGSYFLRPANVETAERVGFTVSEGVPTRVLARPGAAARR